MDYRIEKDSMGEMQVPADRYWAAQTQRSFENFRIGTETMPLGIIRAFAVLKKAAAATNFRLGKLDEERCGAIAAVCDEIGMAPFDASGNRNAGLATGRENAAEAVPTTTPDALLAGKAIDYIKYDVEGAEAAALRGTVKTLQAQRPRLKIACYHRSDDLFALPLLLSAIAPDHALYLTRRRSVPAWDLDLLALPL